MHYGKLFIVGLPIGNIQDITIRAIETLKSADLILCEDTREFIKLAKMYNITTKLESLHDFNEKIKSKAIIALLIAGKNIALTSDRGTPTISDPGFLLIKNYTELLNYEISNIIIPIPGVSAPITAQSICCFSNTFLFVGFTEKLHLLSLEKQENAMIFFEAPHRISKFIKNALEIFGNRRIFIAREMTKQYEEFCYSTLEKYCTEDPKGEFTIIIEGFRPINQTINHELITKICQMEIQISNKDLANLLSEILNIEKKALYNIIYNIRNK
jgi:16S rRNA (cytidine1402-2'-O)-methyltransferase